MAGAPQGLTFKTHRDRQNWWQSPWWRLALLLVPLALAIAGLANVFGQKPTRTQATGSGATLSVFAPTQGRSGLIYAARFRIDAIKEIKQATLLLDGGWADGYTVNGAAPQPVTQGETDGKLNFGFGHIPAGHHVTFWLSLQINPTTIGTHRQDVALYDGDHLLATVKRSIRIYP